MLLIFLKERQINKKAEKGNIDIYDNRKEEEGRGQTGNDYLF
jgi:hypothetical protein